MEYRLNDRVDVFGEALYASASKPRVGGGDNNQAISNGAPAEQSVEDGMVGTFGVRCHLSAQVELSASLSCDNSNATLLRSGLQIRF